MPDAVPRAPGADLDTPPPGYVEEKYVRAYADVASAVRTGQYESGLEHYLRYGHAERRLAKLDYLHGYPVVESPHFPPCGIDALFWTESGHALVIGWIDDRGGRLASISLSLDETLLGATDAIGRCRRMDAERAVGGAEGMSLGFWSVFATRTDVARDAVRVVMMTSDSVRTHRVTAQKVNDERLRELALEYFASASYWGNPQVEGFAQLDGGLGETLIAVNETISARIAAGAFCRRFGPQPGRFAASLIICLYGRLEYLFLQAALFTTGAGWPDYEFIYVSNSPELTEILFKEATLAAQIYGVSISLVILPGNAGFGVANNAAAGFAQSDRLIIINPDVFPRRADWAEQHRALIADLPEEQSRIFGAPLFYDDGSLMHAGMHFELDDGFSLGADGVRLRALARVEHYGKGAPPHTAHWLASRPVPAVTGAFISVARGWFETLGGFSPKFIFGHYEDADLCLRSRAQGGTVWLHHLPFWHMEGKGSARRALHEGGSLVNRWYFTRMWEQTIRDGMLGAAPAALTPETMARI